MLCNHRFGEQFLGYEPQSSRFGFGCKPSVEPQKWDKQHSRFTWFHLYHNVCHSFHICWVNIQIFGISVLWKAGTAGGEIGEKKKKKKKISPRLLVCLSDWHSKAESESESNFICLLSGPHVSWPMTYHLVAVIPWQWCCDLALPQSDSPLLTAAGLGWVEKWKGGRKGNALLCHTCVLLVTGHQLKSVIFNHKTLLFAVCNQLNPIFL